MPHTLYDTDILGWSLTEAAKLRRLAAGERVNDIDWAHVIAEVEDVGKSELKAVRSHLELALLHALKLLAWPGHTAATHWRGEIDNLLVRASTSLEPGMRQHFDLAVLYTRALRRARGLAMDALAPLPLPELVPLDADAVGDEAFDAADLLDRIRAAQAPLPTPSPAPVRQPQDSPMGPRSAG